MKPLWHKVTVRYLQGIGMKAANDIVREAFEGYSIRKIRKDAGKQKPKPGIYGSLMIAEKMEENAIGCYAFKSQPPLPAGFGEVEKVKP